MKQGIRRLGAVGLLFAVIGLAPSAAIAQTPTAADQQLFASVDQLLMENKTDDARYWRRCDAHRWTDDWAVADFSASIKNEDNTPDTYANRARAYLALGKKDLAKSDWETAIGLDRQYGDCVSANVLTALEPVLFNVQAITVVACK